MINIKYFRIVKSWRNLCFFKIIDLFSSMFMILFTALFMWGETMSIFKDFLIGLLFITGAWGFISGEFIISTVLFAGAAIFSNIVRRPS